MTIAFLNGEYMPLSEAKISPMDRGFLFGDGIYEVIPTYAGNPVGFKGHTTRMAQGLERRRTFALSREPCALRVAPLFKSASFRT